VMAEAFSSRVYNAVTAFSWASFEPLALAHRATSSIAAASAYWLCSRRVNTSAVAMRASVLSGTAHSLSLSLEVVRAHPSPFHVKDGPAIRRQDSCPAGLSRLQRNSGI
jgi:hypothetical protein